MPCFTRFHIALCFIGLSFLSLGPQNVFELAVKKVLKDVKSFCLVLSMRFWYLFHRATTEFDVEPVQEHLDYSITVHRLTGNEVSRKHARMIIICCDCGESCTFPS